MNERQKTVRALLLGGILPLIVFTLVEEYFGTVWGLVAGMVFGVGEIIYEKVKQGKVDIITWIGNGMILGLGSVSLFTKEGFWFKLQPAILEAFMAAVLIGSVLLKKPFLILMAKKQNLFERLPPDTAPLIAEAFTGLTVRLGIFFFLHAILATWAALHWSTRAWVFLKGIGFTGSLFLYFGIEILLMRKRLKRAALSKREVPA
jgi:intracellular septation protein